MKIPRHAVPILAVLVGAVPTAVAQTSAEVSRIKAVYLADLADVAGKFQQLAEAFPPSLYGWRPMPGTRSVSQVLGLVAGEIYGDVVPAFGGTTPAEIKGNLEEVTDKATLKRHLAGGYALARQTITAWHGAAEGPIDFWGAKRPPVGVFATLMADQHEHLGQLIAYARMNQIVPPWSR